MPRLPPLYIKKYLIPYDYSEIYTTNTVTYNHQLPDTGSNSVTHSFSLPSPIRPTYIIGIEFFFLTASGWGTNDNWVGTWRRVSVTPSGSPPMGHDSSHAVTIVGSAMHNFKEHTNIYIQQTLNTVTVTHEFTVTFWSGVGMRLVDVYTYLHVYRPNYTS